MGFGRSNGTLSDFLFIDSLFQKSLFFSIPHTATEVFGLISHIVFRVEMENVYNFEVSIQTTQPFQFLVFKKNNRTEQRTIEQ